MAKNQKNPKTQEQAPTSAQAYDDQEVEVLYQRMGDRWYAFSLIDDEVFFGSISSEEIIAADNAKPGTETNQ